LVFIFYYYYKIEEEHQSEALFLEMKNYSFYFDDDRFDMDIVSQNNDTLYELMFDEKNVYILVPLGDSSTDRLKVYYSIAQYQTLLTEIRQRLYIQFFILTLIALLIALLFSYYSLRPLRNSLHLLEEFIKDIIHDLNTPISSIRLNLTMMKDDKRSKSIEKSVQSIAMLHKNLDSYLRERPMVKESLFLKEIVEDQVAFFQPLYDYLDWQIELDESMVYSDRHALSRIVYNVMSNACKYNTLQGTIVIKVKENHIIIENDSYGVKEPSKVFHRFYKESERGLGIGLHIVEKLTAQLEIEKSFVLEDNHVIVTLKLS
jgi:two-component system OmpR family sensor kinase